MGDIDHTTAAQERLDSSVQVTCPRNVQFAGFAQRVADDITIHAIMSATRSIQEIIAQHAYALVRHTLSNIAPIDLDRLSLDEQVETIPDMTTWEAQ